MYSYNISQNDYCICKFKYKRERTKRHNLLSFLLSHVEIMKDVPSQVTT